MKWKRSILLLGSVTGLSLGAAALADTQKTDPVLIEIFTSQGCSSCPPADHLLGTWGMELFEKGQALPLAFHVDYWDRLGWKDPFSSPDFTLRQRRYGSALNNNRIYTPQMVVSGKVGFVGSDRIRAGQEFRKATRGTTAQVGLDLSLGPRGKKTTAAITVHPRAGSRCFQVWLAVFENGLKTRVLRGENLGKSLGENFVVRSLVKAADSRGSEPLEVRSDLEWDPEWKRESSGVAVFVQDTATLEILGVEWVYPVKE